MQSGSGDERKKVEPITCMVTTKSGSPVTAYPVGFTSASSLLLETDTLEIRHLYGGVIKKKTDKSSLLH